MGIKLPSCDLFFLFLVIKIPLSCFFFVLNPFLIILWLRFHLCVHAILFLHLNWWLISSLTGAPVSRGLPVNKKKKTRTKETRFVIDGTHIHKRHNHRTGFWHHSKWSWILASRRRASLKKYRPNGLFSLRALWHNFYPSRTESSVNYLCW